MYQTQSFLIMMEGHVIQHLITASSITTIHLSLARISTSHCYGFYKFMIMKLPRYDVKRRLKSLYSLRGIWWWSYCHRSHISLAHGSLLWCSCFSWTRVHLLVLKRYEVCTHSCAYLLRTSWWYWKRCWRTTCENHGIDLDDLFV